MRKLFLIFVFTTTFCFSQNKENIEFSTKQIDSICERNGSYGNSDGKIELPIETKKRKKVITKNGTGGYSITTYLHHYNENKYNELSKIEKRKYDFEKYSSLIKGNYHQVIHYHNSYSENINGEFYYFNNLLTYVKIKIIRNEKNKEDQFQTFNYSISELNNSKSIKNVFLFEVKSWVKEKNNEILEFYKLK
jgi:hypothetical protein